MARTAGAAHEIRQFSVSRQPRSGARRHRHRRDIARGDAVGRARHRCRLAWREPFCRDLPLRRPDGPRAREAMLSDELGIDVFWLGEHHFDGICAYADPIGLAGALAIALKRAALGFAVLQTSLHHPIRLAEQLAVIDNLTKGRLIVGLGRGSSYNIYDYQGFGIAHHEPQDRLEEAEEIILRAWTEGAFRHDGRFWQLDVPILRPRPYTKPHPPLIRGSSGDARSEERRVGKECRS